MTPIYLTFDDGPDAEWTPRVLEALASANMHATFFAIGEQARRAPELVRAVLEAGHALGNHTYSHRHPWMLTSRAARAQVRDGAEALAQIAGEPPRFFRPPHGRQRACMADEARALGEKTVMWNVSAIDWGPLGKEQAIAGRLDEVKAHDVVLMHDGRNRHNRPDQLLRVLPGFLARLQDRGLRSVVLT